MADGMTWESAVQTLTGPGGAYEITIVSINRNIRTTTGVIFF